MADGPVSFVRCTHPSWQTGELLVFQMHGNGHTYRHNGFSLDTVSPGVHCLGPSGGDSYTGIASVLERDGSLYAFTHIEAGLGTSNHVARIGVATSDLLGYEWNHEAPSVVTGQDLQSEGFRGATGPSVVELPNGSLVMLYTNRFGNGRHSEIWRATANHPLGPWRVRGPVITEDAAGPHFYGQTPNVVWSIPNERWMCVYNTDSAIRYRYSGNLRRWGNARDLLTKPQQYLQTSGYYRWYGTLLDDTQDVSWKVGSAGFLSEHHISATNPNDRYPAVTEFRIDRQR